MQGLETSAAADVIAASLLSGERRSILLVNYAIQHRDASQIVALAQVLGSLTGATGTSIAANSGSHSAVDLVVSGSAMISKKR